VPKVVGLNVVGDGNDCVVVSCWKIERRGERVLSDVGFVVVLNDVGLLSLDVVVDCL